MSSICLASSCLLSRTDKAELSTRMPCVGPDMAAAGRSLLLPFRQNTDGAMEDWAHRRLERVSGHA
eukprot:1266751-Rhodomonas_salina.2